MKEVTGSYHFYIESSIYSYDETTILPPSVLSTGEFIATSAVAFFSFELICVMQIDNLKKRIG